MKKEDRIRELEAKVADLQRSLTVALGKIAVLEAARLQQQPYQPIPQPYHPPYIGTPVQPWYPPTWYTDKTTPVAQSSGEMGDRW